ncbi:hypothetical protein IDH41_11335 [Paenibacillus sp. IB182493]|uniref:Uncharacterized protein n=2 Tax=Paenibacillus arenilitoris TaxID=2772299 RepID=A0A927CP57_9BACL|nr:hypothetical protein [Paenibacillus arenilitoris]
MPYHTDLRTVFEAFGGRQLNYNWLLTDLECNHYPEPVLPYDDEGRPLWLTGEQLSKVVSENDIQFIWGVLSGFDKTVEVDMPGLQVEPSAGNPEHWNGAPAIQHPKAKVEIVCWDSSCTLLLSQDDELSRRFRSFFKEAVDLDEYNASRNNG